MALPGKHGDFHDFYCKVQTFKRILQFKFFIILSPTKGYYKKSVYTYSHTFLSIFIYNISHLHLHLPRSLSPPVYFFFCRISFPFLYCEVFYFFEELLIIGIQCLTVEQITNLSMKKNYTVLIERRLHF